MSSNDVSGPRIEILTVRDPDESVVVRMWIDGVETPGYAGVDVDPGAGHQLEDWLQSQIDLLLDDSSSEGFRLAALEAYEAYDSSQYVVDDEGTPHVRCYHGTGHWPDLKFCQWSEPIVDIHLAAAALRAHRTAAHPAQA